MERMAEIQKQQQRKKEGAQVEDEQESRFTRMRRNNKEE